MSDQTMKAGGLMPDRRPSKLELADLRVLTDLGGFEPDDRYVRPGTRPATLADLIAAVRRGVESGTIKGVVRNEVYCDTCGAVTIRSENHTHGRLVTRWYLRIPVSDGGEDRP